MEQLLISHWKRTENLEPSPSYDFDRIRLKFDYESAGHPENFIAEGTLNDLDFERLFEFLDHTESAPGRQYLYAQLRSPEGDQGRFDELLENVTKPDLDFCSGQLAKLGNPGAYYLQTLIHQPMMEKPRWYWVIICLSLLGILSLITMILYPPAWFVFAIILITNFVVHYWNKRNVLSYSNALPNLIALAAAGENISRKVPAFDHWLPCVRKIRRVTRNAVYISWEVKGKSELAQLSEFLFELVKIVFLLEPLLFFRLLHLTGKCREDIGWLADRVGELDTAISISKLRLVLPAWCQPKFTSGEWQMRDAYHPLLLQAVSNQVTIVPGESLLITGSNMSGKTSFIRMAGVNVLLAQTMNTVCAAEFHLPPCSIHSSIANEDNMEEGISYFQRELNRVKSMLHRKPAEKHRLILIDELFKGTNSAERIAAARAVLSHLAELNTVLATTHDLPLAALLAGRFTMYHFTDVESNGELTYDYLLKEGILERTNAIRLMELNDFPEEIIGEARRELNRM